MEPLSTTTALASIIGLIGQFKAGRDSAKSQDFNEFMQWLAESNHAELKSLIEANHGTTISIKAILHQSQEALTESLSRIDNALAAITTALAGFGELSKSIRPNAVLSEQAVSILKQIDEAEASQVLLVKDWEGGAELLPLDGRGDEIEILEPRFLESDLKSAVDAGLLIQSFNSTGERIWVFTRSAAAFVASIPS
ncbi:hypothetical protein [Phytopseudomonas daroniae]|uniref:hypothetical protein n=1 Tax=Phytopseudomonas daroniae TaxID=2487519 RepID=UPI00103842DE|nr:hypothetical protein [Pseudomonas daroniae]TBU73296.1 hypothetical protein DNK10_18705 [Pseudomonas daroniae]